METTLDYTRWDEKPRGVAYRRWAIVSTGLRQMFRTRFFRVLLFLAWTAGVLVAAIGFLFSQSVATGGWLESLAATFGPRAQAVASAFCGLVLLYPDVVVQGLFTLIFWVQSFVGLWLSLIALTVVVPRLVTRDRASNALTIYLSRPLTSLDYLLGKLGMIVGILLAMWTGPLLFGWILGVLFAPDRVFIVHSLVPLLRALLFNLIGLVVLSAIAMGVSSATKSLRNTILLWIGVWIVAGVLADFPTTPDWLRRASFSHDLRETRAVVFRLDEALIRAGEALPVVDRRFAANLKAGGEHLRSKDVAGALGGLAVLVAGASVVFFKRLRPE